MHLIQDYIAGQRQLAETERFIYYFLHCMSDRAHAASQSNTSCVLTLRYGQGLTLKAVMDVCGYSDHKALELHLRQTLQQHLTSFNKL